MWYGFTIILTLLLLFSHPQKDPNYNKQGRPSTYGINTYIKNNEESFIREYEYRVDSLFDVYVYADNLDETSDGDLGQFYIPDYIVVTNREKYVAYEFNQLSKFKQRTTSYRERTVKAVVFHELTHAYFYQIMITMRNNGERISPEYSTLRMFPISKFNTDFIEEGICEYMVYRLNESNPIKDIAVPDNMTDLLDENNVTNNIYCYSVIFLKDFLDTHGIKEGIKILISNNPPSYEEILNPDSFYNRIKY